MALWIIENATDETVEEGVTVYQNMILENNKTYLIRVFVNESKTPPLIITAYKAIASISKERIVLSKCWRVFSAIRDVSAAHLEY